MSREISIYTSFNTSKNRERNNTDLVCEVSLKYPEPRTEVNERGVGVS